MLNKPKLRFKEFNDEWHEGKLEDYCIINPDTCTLPETFYYIDLECVVNGRIVSNINIIDKNNAPSRAQRVLTVNDLLYQMVRPYQRNNFLFTQVKELPTVASTGYAQIRTKDNDIRFLYQKLHTDSFVKCAMQRSTGTGYPAINSTDLATISIKIPTKDEQQKIAKFLSKVDEIIAEREEEVNDLEQQKKGLMQKIFSQQLRFTDSNNNPYPDWKDTTLEEIYNFKYGQYNNNPDNGGQYPIYGANGIIGGYTEYNAENSVIIGHMGAYAGSVIFEKEKHFVTYNGTITTPKDNIVLNSKYGYYLLLNLNIRRICDGSGQPFLSYDTLNRIKVKISEITEEQQKIANLLSKMDELIEEKKALLSDWQQFKKGLLQQMFI